MEIRLTPYIVLNGQANEAIDFYLKAFNGEELYPRIFLKDHADEMGYTLSKVNEDCVMHSHIAISETELNVADKLPDQTLEKGSLVTIMISVENSEDAVKIFNALKENGKVIMDITDTSFSNGIGHVEDKYGVQWQIASNN
ncbi:MAG: VOC family protein [Bacilli bacterium]